MAGKLVIKPAKGDAPIKLRDLDQMMDRMHKMYSSIANRAFEIFENKGRIFGRDLEDWFRAESELLHPVQITIQETEEGLTVEAEVPGFSTEELEVNVEPRRLTITGERVTQKEQTEGRTIYSERRANKILRVVDLPVEVDSAKVTATLKDGVLSFNLPKAAPAKKVHIETKAA